MIRFITEEKHSNMVDSYTHKLGLKASMVLVKSKSKSKNCFTEVHNVVRLQEKYCNMEEVETHVTELGYLDAVAEVLEEGNYNVENDIVIVMNDEISKTALDGRMFYIKDEDTLRTVLYNIAIAHTPSEISATLVSELLLQQIANAGY